MERMDIKHRLRSIITLKKSFFILFLVFIISPVFAKREAPLDVEPVEINGKRYVVNHWGHPYSQRQNGGFIEIWDIEDNTLIEVVRVYKTFYFPLLERDVQDVFITDLSVSEDNKYLIIKTENDRIYYLDLETNRIVKL